MNRWLKQTLYSMAANSGLTRVRHRRMGHHNVSILMYHLVVPEPLPYFNWCAVLETDFRYQMEYLARHFEVLRFRDIPSRLADPMEPSRPLACVTFDDGYQNNHDVAFPVLRDRDIPATIFLATQFPGTQALIWDADIYLAIQGATVPALEYDGESLRIETAAEKAGAFQTVCRDLKQLPQSELLARVGELVTSLAPESRDLSAFRLRSVA